jgi:hypothetical protein
MVKKDLKNGVPIAGPCGAKDRSSGRLTPSSVFHRIEPLVQKRDFALEPRYFVGEVTIASAGFRARVQRVLRCP